MENDYLLCSFTINTNRLDVNFDYKIKLVYSHYVF